jgi:UDP-N-acetylglucosamine 2-epimerase (non-hydrolysing)/GDP/UDP-N,N'-diacetylbacillosamine 2-epimerase (hydrolysing)
MNVVKKVCFFTGKRGGFTHMIPVIEGVKGSDKLDYCVLASDMHLSNTFGSTINEVKIWAENIYCVDSMLSSHSRVSRAKSIGIGLMSYAQMLDTIRPDFVFILGDRGEVLAMAISAMEMNIPILHLFGGDLTQGGVDEPVRHAITKMANVHFTSNQESADRILRMGEEPWRVHNVGSPALDLIRKKKFTPPDEICAKFKLDKNCPILILLQHSVTWQVAEAEYQINKTMEAVDHLGYQTIAIYPCSDPGYDDIIKVLLEYEDKPYFQLFENIEFSDFWGLMNIASAFIGNSSAGVMETASFKIPFVNIGIRQEGRLRADNVIDVDHRKDQIIEAIQTAVNDKKFREKVNNCVSHTVMGKPLKRLFLFCKILKLTKISFARK